MFQNFMCRHFTQPQHSSSLSAIVYAVNGIKVAPHSESKWNGIGLLCSSGAKPQKINFAMALRRVALTSTLSDFLYGLVHMGD